MKKMLLRFPLVTLLIYAFVFAVGTIGFKHLDKITYFVKEGEIIFFPLIWQLVFFVVCLITLKTIGFDLHKHKGKQKIFNLFLGYSLFIIVVMVAMKIGPFDFHSSLQTHVFSYLNVILLALCEEFLYRGLAFALFKQTDRFYSIKHVMLVNFIFALTILIEIVPAPHDAVETIFLAFYYFSFGVFLTANHLYTKSVLLPTLIHVVKGVLTLFVSLSVSAPFLPTWAYYVALIFLFAFQMTVACFYLLKNPHRIPRVAHKYHNTSEQEQYQSKF